MVLPSPPRPAAFLMARSIGSSAMPALRAFSSARRRRGLSAGFAPPPSCTATVMSLPILEMTAARRLSFAAFLCLMLDQWLCLAMSSPIVVEHYSRIFPGGSAEGALSGGGPPRPLTLLFFVGGGAGLGLLGALELGRASCR